MVAFIIELVTYSSRNMVGKCLYPRGDYSKCIHLQVAAISYSVW